MFSATSRVAFPGDTSALLHLLAFGTALPMVLGFFFVRPIPLPPTEDLISLGPVGSPGGHGMNGGGGDEEEQLLAGDELGDSNPPYVPGSHTPSRVVLHSLLMGL